jgi:hypothetical protein
MSFPKYLTNVLLGDLNAKVEREYIFNPTIGQDNNDNGVRLSNFATSKILVVKSKMSRHLNIRKYIWTSPDGKTHKPNNHVLIDRRWHSSVLEVRSFMGADFDSESLSDDCKV